MGGVQEALIAAIRENDANSTAYTLVEWMAAFLEEVAMAAHDGVRGMMVAAPAACATALAASMVAGLLLRS